MAREIENLEKQAESMKDLGNQYFKKGKLGAAIEAYTQAIDLCPKVPTFWTNRALCYKKRNEWDKAERDCLKALKLDNSLIKAHYMLGLALLEREQYHDATYHLEKALELGKRGSAGSDMFEEIWLELAKARYIQWQVEAANRQRKQRELKDSLFNLMMQDYEKKLRDLTLESSTENAQFGCRGLNRVSHLTDEEVSAYHVVHRPVKESQVSAGEHHKAEIFLRVGDFQNRLRTMEEVFDKASALDRPGEIPDYLCCQISTDIFRDPVVTPSGVTYERSILLEHLCKVGKFDPITRATLHSEQVTPNLAVKDAVQTFLSQNGWAYKIWNQ